MAETFNKNVACRTIDGGGVVVVVVGDGGGVAVVVDGGTPILRRNIFWRDFLGPSFSWRLDLFCTPTFRCFWSLAPQQSIIRDPSVSSPSVLAMNHFEWQDLVKSLVSTWTWGNHYFRCATVTLTWKLKLWYEWNPPIMQNNYSNSINEVRQAQRELNYSW